MASSEKVVSPGVFTNEIDQTFLPAAVADIGAALIGPTVKGPAGIPTIVNSYSDFQATFGDVQMRHTASAVQYLTSHAAKEYLKHAGTLTVVRILDGTYSPAHSFIPTGSGNFATGSHPIGDSGVGRYQESDSCIKLTTLSDGAIMNNVSSSAGGGWEGADIGGNNILTGSGSKDNIRWEISNQNTKKGTFTLLIRRGDDNIKRKKTVETWNNVSLDPSLP